MLLNLNKEKMAKKIARFYENNYDTLDHLVLSPKQIELNNREYFGVISGDEIIAITSFEKMTDNLVQTHGTVVKEDLRNQGLGGRVNSQLEGIIKDLGVKKISCNIYVDNLPSIVLKLKRGYLVEGLLRNHDVTGQHEYILSKEL